MSEQKPIDDLHVVDPEPSESSKAFEYWYAAPGYGCANQAAYRRVWEAAWTAGRLNVLEGWVRADARADREKTRANKFSLELDEARARRKEIAILADREQRMRVSLRAALQRVVFCAMTPGGVAGRDDELAKECEAAEAVLMRDDEWRRGDRTEIEEQRRGGGSDTESEVYFYEREFYPLSNFSAFTLKWFGFLYPTSEHAYQRAKFVNVGTAAARSICIEIEEAPSAHEAYKIAERNAAHRRKDWDDVKVNVMRNILREKCKQHEYVRRKLLETGDRILVEDSWRDAFWGWGEDRQGLNTLGKLWMEVRAELAAQKT